MMAWIRGLVVCCKHAFCMSNIKQNLEQLIYFRRKKKESNVVVKSLDIITVAIVFILSLRVHKRDN